MDGVGEVTAFLTKLGLEQCVQAVVHNGFYTSMEALRGATYEELVDSGVRPGHAKLMLSELSNAGLSTAPLSVSSDPAGGEVAAFLRSVGLEACLGALEGAGYSSVDALSRATLNELVGIGLKPVHARLIVSNLDGAASLGLQAGGGTRGSFDEESLLGGTRKKQPPVRLYAIGACLLLSLLVLYLGSGGGAGASAGGGGGGGGHHHPHKPRKEHASRPPGPASPQHGGVGVGGGGYVGGGGKGGMGGDGGGRESKERLSSKGSKGGGKGSKGGGKAAVPPLEAPPTAA